MTDNTRSTQAILSEARDTIAATFWVRQIEVQFATAISEWDEETEKVVFDYTAYEAAQKYINAELSETFIGGEDEVQRQYAPEGKKAKVVGVCSIGAIALANTTLYDMPLDSWMHIQARDIHTYLAGAALAMTIWQNEPTRYASEAHGQCIASWNDYDERTREEVLEAFDAALAHPLAQPGVVPVTIDHHFDYFDEPRTRPTNLIFASQEEAQMFLDNESALRRRVFSFTTRSATGELEDTYSSRNNRFVIAPVQHPGLVSA